MAPPPTKPLLDVALQSIELATKELNELTCRVGDFVRGTLGSIPETGNIGRAGRAEASGGSRAEALHERLAALDNQVGDLRSQVNRLEGI